MNRWDADEKLLRLPLLLKERAFAVYERHATAGSYDDLVKGIKQSFAPDTKEARRLVHRQLQDRKMQAGEDVKVFLRVLERLIDRAAPNLPNELRNRQLIDYFLEGLPTPVADQLFILAPKKRLKIQLRQLWRSAGACELGESLG